MHKQEAPPNAGRPRRSSTNQAKTGPATQAGKRASSLNSTAHGLCQERFLLLPGESPAAFEALRVTYLAQYDLDAPAVPQLVETLTERDWLQQRCTLRICKLEAQLAEAEHSCNDEAIDKLERRLANAQRYKTAAENSFKRALQILEQFRKSRIREAQAARRIEVSEFTAAERALVARIRYDIDINQEMQVITHEQSTDGSEPIPSGEISKA